MTAIFIVAPYLVFRSSLLVNRLTFREVCVECRSEEHCMRIARLEAFQVQWRPEDPPSARSGFLRVFSDDGRCGLGEVSPMQGGLVSLTILKHHIAPAIVGADPLDHAVIHDRLLHRLVKLGPEGALTSA